MKLEIDAKDIIFPAIFLSTLKRASKEGWFFELYAKSITERQKKLLEKLKNFPREILLP